jgi:hypothetical protein
MKNTNLSCRSAPRGLEMHIGCLFFYFVLCLLTSLPAAAQADSLTPFSADLDGYAKLGFYVPSEAAVEPEDLAEANYTEGREVKATLLINGSRVSLHLLYPCQAPVAQLEPAALKAAIDGYNSGMAQAVYNPTPLNVSGQSASWGQVSNQIFVAYQPSVQTIALVLIDESLDETSMEYLLGSLQITVNKGSSPLWPGFCPDTSGSTAAPAKAASENVAVAAGSNLLENLKSGGEARETRLETGKERMSSDMEAAQERLAAAKNKLKGF